MKILGISPFHDSSVCIINDGYIEKFYKEERLNGVKRCRNPFSSINKILENTKVDAAVIASPSNNDETLGLYKAYLEENMQIKDIVDLSEEHHLQHASLAFYNSGFDQALVFVIDRNGSQIKNLCRESESVFVASYPHTFLPIYKNYWLENMSFAKHSSLELYEKFKNLDYEIEIDCASTHGLVKTYESATTLIGQHVLENGKTMGLSAYGKSNNEYKNLFLDYGIGNYNILSIKENSYESINKNIFNNKTNNVTKENYKIYADYAFEIQKQSQEAALSLIKKFIKKTGIKKVCITGGYGLNVVANSFYLENLSDVEFYFEPLADDTGNSIGGAQFYYRYMTKDMEIKKYKNTFFHGDQEKIKNAGKRVAIEDIANLLASNKSVAIHYGLAEAGPRALGHRSILFDARDPNAKDKVNLVKKREWYRPFAGVMLVEDAEKYFYINDYINSQNMTVNFKCKDVAKKEIPGILHVDDTCRIQIVCDEEEPIFKLLNKFKERTGIGVLLNTSFNLAGKPLVESYHDALYTLKNSDLDFVWFPEIEKLVK